MTQIDFHILPDLDQNARFLYCCRLVEKISSLGHEVLIMVDDESQAMELDDLLWSFKPESFIPHQIIGADDPIADESIADESIKVEISFNHALLGEHQNVLVNLSQQIPQAFSRFSRLCEIVIQEPKILNATREHYKFYKERGYPIQQHKR